jgi:hypothetical protein
LFAYEDMTGVPYQLTGVPRGQVPDDQVRNDAQPPTRKNRPRKSNNGGNGSSKDSHLEAISERGPHFSAIAGGAMPPPAHYQTARSSAEAASMLSGSDHQANEEEDDERRRVQKGQINTLAKMLSALRR